MADPAIKTRAKKVRSPLLGAVIGTHKVWTHEHPGHKTVTQDFKMCTEKLANRETNRTYGSIRRNSPPWQTTIISHDVVDSQKRTSPTLETNAEMNVEIVVLADSENIVV